MAAYKDAPTITSRQSRCKIKEIAPKKQEHKKGPAGIEAGPFVIYRHKELLYDNTPVEKRIATTYTDSGGIPALRHIHDNGKFISCMPPTTI